MVSWLCVDSRIKPLYAYTCAALSPDFESSNLAITFSNLSILCIHTSKLRRISISESIHRILGNVESSCRMIDCKHVDRFAPVRKGVTGAALRGS